MKITPANGTKGMLIWCGGDKYVFRVYDKDRDFVDYDLRHSDMEIEIQESDAYFYEDGDYKCVDHAPATLGIKQ